MNLSKILTRAHQIRTAAAQEAGIARSDVIWSICLKMAWAEARKPAPLTESDCIAAGGNLWVSRDGSRRRVYFDQWAMAAMIGLNVTRYGSGSISHAELNGVCLSNNQASKMVERLKAAGLYYEAGYFYHNLADGEFQTIKAGIRRAAGSTQTLAA